jgi:hypothetical protein
MRTLVDYLIRNNIDFTINISGKKNKNKHRVKPVRPLTAWDSIKLVDTKVNLSVGMTRL